MVALDGRVGLRDATGVEQVAAAGAGGVEREDGTRVPSGDFLSAGVVGAGFQSFGSYP